MQGNGLSLHRTSLCHKLPADLKQKLVAFLQHVIGHSDKNKYLSQVGNADEVTACFGMPYSYTPDGTGAKCVVIPTSGYEMMCVTVMLLV